MQANRDKVQKETWWVGERWSWTRAEGQARRWKKQEAAEAETHSVKAQGRGVREESRRTGKNENCRHKVPRLRNIEKEMLAKSLLEQSSERERNKQQAWESEIQLSAGLKRGVLQFKRRGRCQLVRGRRHSNRGGLWATVRDLWGLNTVPSEMWADFFSNCQVFRHVQDYPLPWRRENERLLRFSCRSTL